jgi:hypothetical protein
LAGCGEDPRPCYWQAQQDREASELQAVSLACDGSVTAPAGLHAIYEASTPPLLNFIIDAFQLRVDLTFDGSLPDGTYAVESPLDESTGQPPEDPAPVTASGAQASGTFTFSRSRDVPFVDVAHPEAKQYESTIDATFDLVALLPHPDPAMGPGCRLETGEQHVSLLVTGPVVECRGHFTTGAH